MPNQIQDHVKTLPAVFLAGLALDELFGDPPNSLHPTAWFGRWAGWLEKRLYRDSISAGIVFMLAATIPPSVLAWLIERRLAKNELAKFIWQSLCLWQVIGVKSLAREGQIMGQALIAEDLDGARNRLNHLCGRKAEGLAAADLSRATVESLAENTADCLAASLFAGFIGGSAGMVFHRMINTLDAMVGSRSPRYERFGKASARTDDLLDLIPARIVGVLACIASPIVGGSIKKCWQITKRDAHRHPSPNGGWCEAAWASALGVQLGGKNIYAHRVEYRGLLNRGARKADGGDAIRAAHLVHSVSWLAALGFAGLAWAIGKGK